MEKKRNLWVIPTDKPSRLLYNFTLKSFCIQTEKDGMFINDGNVAGADFWSIEKANNNGFRYINICITSNEEIKVNDYITDGYKVWQWKDDSSLLGRKKVILTTDQDLIKDGVQAIDDEFLEWFVKNPSCEFIEIVDDWNSPIIDAYEYKIIIPKEEPKQDVTSKNHALIFDDSTYERKKFNSLLLDVGHWSFPKEEPKEETLVRDYSNRSCKTCSLFNANNSGEGVCELELESECASYSNDETLEDFWISCLDDESDSVLYKQETLEEVAERYAKSEALPENQINCKEDFIAGAKWQQEQNKNLYSEEEVRLMLRELSSDLYEIYPLESLEQWFEQFKKK